MGTPLLPFFFSSSSSSSHWRIANGRVVCCGVSCRVVSCAVVRVVSRVRWCVVRRGVHDSRSHGDRD
jgi:hypothetical protein